MARLVAKKDVSSFDRMTLDIEPKPKITGKDKKKLQELIRRADILTIGGSAKLHHHVSEDPKHTAFEIPNDIFVIFNSTGELEVRSKNFDLSKAKTVDKLVEDYLAIVTKELRRKVAFEGGAMFHIVSKNPSLKSLLQVGLRSSVSPYLKEKLGDKIKAVTLTAILQQNLAISLVAPDDIDFYSLIQTKTGTKGVVSKYYSMSIDRINQLSRSTQQR